MACDVLISTDPPYYDNIGYADLSDFFYVWLRRSLQSVFPRIFATLLVPKASELVATPYRFGGSKAKAEQFFEEGLGRAFANMHAAQHAEYPLTIYYAFKQADHEDKDGGTPTSTGWETMLTGLLDSGFQVDGTWPMRSELSNRMIASGTNALASSIVLVCRPRAATAEVATRREFQRALREELPRELRVLTAGRVAPVDLAQAVIGPGMAVFSRYRQVVEADGKPMSVRAALGLINTALDAYFSEREGDLDAASRFCVAWYGQHGTAAGPYGDAETLSRAKNVGTDALARRGLVEQAGGKLRLLRPDEYAPEGERATHGEVAVWEACGRLATALATGGEGAAARLTRRLGGAAEQARELAYRLYAVADRRGWTAEARAYNELVASWPAIKEQAALQDDGEQGLLV